ncbi:MAG: ABC transporter substrate-binding protein [Candidatus Binatia bacterium]
MDWNRCTFLIAFFLGFSISSNSYADLKNLIPKAKKEGTLVWYATTSNPDNQAIVKGFNRKYPFLKVNVLKTTGEKLRTRILIEAAADKHFFDVVVVSTLELGLVKSKNLLLSYRSPEARPYPDGAKDPDGTFTGIYVRNFVIGYNKNMVSERDAPRQWRDLLRPKWKGKIGLDEEEFEWYGALIDYWGREKTRNFMRALAGQDPYLRRGHTLLTQLASAGEFPVAIVYPYIVERLKHRGAPMNWVRESDPIITSVNGVAVSAKAPHPNSAKLFVNFILSKEGQTIIRNRFRVPVHPEVTPSVPQLRQSDLKIHYVPGDMFKKIGQYEKEFRELFWKK